MTELRAYDQYPMGHGVCTVLPDMDFETYSEAGYKLVNDKWRAIDGKGKQGGIMRVGAWVYSEHPSAEVLYLSYNLKDGRGPQRWIPGMPPPQDLFDWITGGGLVEAHNSFFEYCIWTNVCVPKLGWPPINLLQLRDSAAKCGAFSLPRALAKAAGAMGTAPKDAAGHAVMLKLSKPRNPTKTNPALRWTPETAPEKFEKLYAYGDQDIVAEGDLSSRLPDLLPHELELWKIDQQINARGIYIDRELVDAAASIVQQAFIKYTSELVMLTQGLVQTVSEIAKIQSWLAACGYPIADMEDDTLKDALKRTDLPSHVRRVIEIRRLIGSAAVKKVSAMQDRMGRDGRLRDMFMFCGAGRTGRWGGSGPQPHNMFSSGPVVAQCVECGDIHIATCPRCPECDGHTRSLDWGAEAMEAVVPAIMSRNLDIVEQLWGDALLAVSGCLRGMFCAAPGHELICSDYSAIEAVVIAMLAGEEWRIEVFRTHGLIYEMSASKITGIPFEDFMKHKEETGQHHPMRKKVGKVAELASGFGGGVGAWKVFGADEFMDDDEIQQKIYAWRKASPNIAGESPYDGVRGAKGLWHGLEDAAHAALMHVGQQFTYAGITYWVQDAVMYCRLLSGRCLAYIRPELRPGKTPWGADTMVLSFEGVMTPKVGYSGGGQWMRLDTWYGQLVENVVQATARDLLAYAMPQLEAAGYSIVLHVHDEIVAEVSEGTGSIEEFEQIMGDMPPWAADWPIKATGGWRGVRYRKD